MNSKLSNSRLETRIATQAPRLTPAIEETLLLRAARDQTSPQWLKSDSLSKYKWIAHILISRSVRKERRERLILMLQEYKFQLLGIEKEARLLGMKKTKFILTGHETQSLEMTTMPRKKKETGQSLKTWKLFSQITSSKIIDLVLMRKRIVRVLRMKSN